MQAQTKPMQVYFTRHAQSVYNAVVEGELKPNDADPMWDCGLSPKGQTQITQHREFFEGKKIDYVLVSPYIRCLETAMATYYREPAQGQGEEKKKPRFYAMSILMEYAESPDCVGSSIPILKEKYPQVDFTALLMKKSPNTEENWYALPFRKNILERIGLFETFLSENRKVFNGKTIHVITHGGFLQNLIHKPVENYQTFFMTFDPQLKKWLPSWRALKPLYSLDTEEEKELKATG